MRFYVAPLSRYMRSIPRDGAMTVRALCATVELNRTRRVKALPPSQNELMYSLLNDEKRAPLSATPVWNIVLASYRWRNICHDFFRRKAFWNPHRVVRSCRHSSYVFTPVEKAPRGGCCAARNSKPSWVVLWNFFCNRKTRISMDGFLCEIPCACSFETVLVDVLIFL